MVVARVCVAALPCALLLLHAPVQTRRACQQRLRLGLFPDEDTPDAENAPQAPPSPPTAPLPLTRDDLVGFWQIFDEQASVDSLNALAMGDSPGTVFSSTIVLRADGQTSRGSDFPGGTWEFSEAMAPDGRTRKRLKIVLRSRLLREEWRYDGLIFGLQEDTETPLGEAKGVATQSSAEAPIEIRVVGKATRWDVSDEDAPTAVGDEASSFSMTKKDVDRRKLIPTVKPFSAPVDPESVRLEQAWRQMREESEEDDIRKAIEEVRKAKAEHGEGWADAIRPVEGVDYWVGGDEPTLEEMGLQGLDDGVSGRSKSEGEGYDA